VLVEEGTAAVDKDLDQLAAIDIQDGSVARLVLNRDKVYSGLAEIKALFESYVGQGSKNRINNFRNSKEIVVMKVTGKTAWIVCDNIWKWE